MHQQLRIVKKILLIVFTVILTIVLVAVYAAYNASITVRDGTKAVIESFAPKTPEGYKDSVLIMRDTIVSSNDSIGY